MFGIDSILVDVCERSKKWIVIISLRVQKFGDDECAQIQEDMEHNSFLDVDKNDKKIKPPHPFKNVSKTATFSIQTTDMPYKTGRYSPRYAFRTSSIIETKIRLKPKVPAGSNILIWL